MLRPLAILPFTSRTRRSSAYMCSLRSTTSTAFLSAFENAACEDLRTGGGQTANWKMGSRGAGGASSSAEVGSGDAGGVGSGPSPPDAGWRWRRVEGRKSVEVDGFGAGRDAEGPSESDTRAEVVSDSIELFNLAGMSADSSGAPSTQFQVPVRHRASSHSHSDPRVRLRQVVARLADPRRAEHQLRLGQIKVCLMVPAESAERRPPCAARGGVPI